MPARSQVPVDFFKISELWFCELVSSVRQDLFELRVSRHDPVHGGFGRIRRAGA
jgi:hypothetical protein